MNEFPTGFLLGLVFGFLTTPILIANNVDMYVDRIRAAEVVCIQANSELVSLDRETATCKNRAEIPYEVKK